MTVIPRTPQLVYFSWSTWSLGFDSKALSPIMEHLLSIFLSRTSSCWGYLLFWFCLLILDRIESCIHTPSAKPRSCNPHEKDCCVSFDDSHVFQSMEPLIYQWICLRLCRSALRIFNSNNQWLVSDLYQTVFEGPECFDNFVLPSKPFSMQILPLLEVYYSERRVVICSFIIFFWIIAHLFRFRVVPFLLTLVTRFICLIIKIVQSP